MSDNKESQLKKLKNMAKLTGIDVEAALKEVQQQTVDMALEQIKPLLSQAMQPEVDLNALAEKVVPALRSNITAYIDKAVADSEVRIASKLAEAIEHIDKKIETAKISGGTPQDAQAIIQGVAEMLKPVIAQESQKGAEAVLKANFQALQSEIYRVMDERLKQAPTASPETVPSQEVMQSPGGGLLGTLSQLLSSPIGEKLIERLFPAPAAPQTAFMADFGRMMSFHDLMTKIEKRTATSEDITKGLANIASPAPTIPQAQAAPQTGQTG